MEKNLTIAIILTIIFLFFYQQFVVKKYTPKKPVEKVEKIELKKEKAKAEKKVKEISEKRKESISKINSEKEINKENIVEASSEKIEVVETDLFKAVFSNKGASLISFKLKKHLGSDKKPLELVSDISRRDNLYPFMVTGEGENVFNKALFTVKKEERKNSIVLTFEYNNGRGDYAKKEFIIRKKGTYKIGVKTEFTIKGSEKKPYLIWGPGLGEIQQEDKGKATFEFNQKIGYFTGGKVKKIDIKKIEKERSLIAEKWVDLDIKYFAVVFFSQGEEINARVFVIDTQNKIKNLRKYAILASKDVSYVYIGPKEYTRLKKLGYSVENIIEYGLFGFIAKILLYLLLYAYKIFPNYGVAIILVTVFLKLILLPLTYSSSISMAKMQELQPQIKKIQAKYKKFPKKDLEARKRMNEEIMALYREKKVNPAGGCLPLLIQLPFLWGFYRLLWVGIEIRHQPFILWLTDLSQKDPYYILPILMGLSQIVIQKMTPSSGSEKSQKYMSYGMAFFFTFLFANFPSGLVLYWLTNNILQAGQQYFVNKALKKKNIVVVRKSKKGKK